MGGIALEIAAGHSPRKRWRSGSNPARIVLELTPDAERCIALNQNGSGHHMVYGAEGESFLTG